MDLTALFATLKGHGLMRVQWECSNLRSQSFRVGRGPCSAGAKRWEVLNISRLAADSAGHSPPLASLSRAASRTADGRCCEGPGSGQAASLVTPGMVELATESESTDGRRRTQHEPLALTQPCHGQRCLRKAPGLKDVDISENRLDDDRAKIVVEAFQFQH